MSWACPVPGRAAASNPPFCVGSLPHLEENVQQPDPSSVVPSVNDRPLLSLSLPLCKVGRD